MNDTFIYFCCIATIVFREMRKVVLVDSIFLTIKTLAIHLLVCLFCGYYPTWFFFFSSAQWSAIVFTMSTCERRKYFLLLWPKLIISSNFSKKKKNKKTFTRVSWPSTFPSRIYFSSFYSAFCFPSARVAFHTVLETASVLVILMYQAHLHAKWRKILPE